MANTEALRSLIQERGVKQRFIADKMGVSDMRVHRLLNGSNWRLEEVVAFCQIFNLTQKQRKEIFLL